MTTRPLRCLLFGVCAIMACFPRGVGAQDNGPSIEPHQVNYRWTRVPEAELKEAARGHIAMDRESFDEIVQRIRDTYSAVPSHRAEVRQAHYEARWEATGLIGVARLDVELHGNAPTFLAFDDMSLAIASAAWQSRPEEPVAIEVDPQGQWRVRVERSDQLILTWSQAVQPSSVAATESVALQLPRCTVNRMEVDLPSTRFVRSSAGTVTFAGNVPRANVPPDRAEEKQLSQQNADATQFARWRIDLGGECRVELTSCPSRSRRQGIPGTLRSQAAYDVRQRGVECVFEFECELSDLSLRELVFLVPASLRIVSAESSDVQAEWTVVPTNDSATRLLVYTLQEQVRTPVFRLRVTALADAPTSADDILPQLRGRDLQWREGVATVRVFDPLVVERCEIQGGRLAAIKRMADTSPGELREVQFHTEDSSIRLHVVTRQPRQMIASGWRVTVGGPRVVAQGVVDVRQEGTAAFTIHCDVPHPWQIDGLICEDVERLERWELTSQDAEGSHVALVLSRPLKPDESLRFRFELSRGNLPIGAVLRDVDLHAMRFSDAMAEQRLVSVDAVPGQALRGDNNAFPYWLTPDMLSPDELERLPNPGLWTYRAEQAGDDVVLALSPGEPDFSANIQISATIGDSNMDWRASVICTPASAVPGRLLIHLSEASDGIPSFTLKESQADTLMPRRLSRGEEQRLGLPAGGETWEMTSLRGPGNQIEIHVARDIKISDVQSPIAVPLVQIPQASLPAGIVEIRSTVRRVPQVHAEPQLQALPAVSGGDRDGNQIPVAAYRYVTLPSSKARPALTVSFPESDGASPAWVSRMVTHTRYLVSGQAVYQTTLTVQNRGSDQIWMSVPQNVQMRRAIVAGNPVNIASGHRFAVELPSSNEQVTATVEYSMNEPAWNSFGFVHPILLRVDLPVLEHVWQVELPAEFRAWRVTAGLTGGRFDESHWLSRFLGHNSVTQRSSLSGVHGLPARQSDYEFLLRPSVHSHSFAYYHRPTVLLIAWGTGLLVAAVATFWVSWSARRYIVLAALAGIAAIAASPPFYIIFVGAFWGLIAAIGIRTYSVPNRYRRLGPLAAPGSDRSDATRNRHAAATHASWWLPMIMALMGTCMCGTVHAQDAPPTNAIAEEAGRVYRVVVPVDENQEATGSYVYPEQEFYDWLLQAKQQIDSDTRTWWLEGARYQIRLQGDKEGGRVQVSECTCRLDIVTQRSDLQVRLPNSQQWQLAARRPILLDGRDAPMVRGADGAVIIGLPTAGTHVVQLSLAVTPSELKGQDGFDLRTVRHPMTQLELAVPVGLQVDVPTAVGGLRRSASGDQMTGTLGPTDLLSVRWSVDRARAGMALSSSQSRRYTRLQIRPNAVAMDVRWEFDWNDETVTQLRWVVDARLRVLPPPAEIGRLEMRSAAGGSQEMVLHLAEPWSGEQSLQLTFLVPHLSGVGVISVPDVQLIGAGSVTHWLGVDVAPSLAYTFDRGSNPAVARGDFESAWGDGAEVDAACDMVESGAPVTIYTQSLPPRCNVKQRLMLVYAPTGCDWEYAFDVEPVQGTYFRYHVSLPRGAVVHRCFLESRDSHRRVRWSRQDEDTVCIFLPEGEDGLHRVVLEGRLELPLDTDLPLPRFAVVDAPDAPGTVHIYRDPRVEVQSTMAEGWTELARSAASAVTQEGYCMVAAMEHRAPEAGACHISVRPNRPIVQGATMTTIYQADGEWWADVECRVIPRNGTLDRVALELADVFDAAAEFSPADRVESHALGDGRRRMIVYLPDATASELTLKLRSKLTTSPTTRFPLVVVQNVDKGKSYIRLPNRDQAGVFQWNVRGLREETSDLGFVVPTDWNEGVTWSVYEVADDAARIELRRALAGSRQTRIPLWQTDCTISNSGAAGRVEFFADVTGDGGVPLQVEPGCRLVHATVDGRWILPVSEGNDRWRLPIEPTGLPRRVIVVFQTPPLPIGRQTTRWLPVWPVGIEPQVVMWSIACPSEYDVRASLPRVDELALQRERWMVEVEMLSRSMAGPGYGRIPAFDQWAWQWMRRLHWQRQSLVPPLNADSDQRWRGAEDQWSALYELQFLADPVAESLFEEEPGEAWDERWYGNVNGAARRHSFFSRSPTLPFVGAELTGPELSQDNDRLLAAVIWSIASCVLAVGLASPRVRQRVSAWGHLFWSAVGVAWLWQGSWPWLGWAAIIFGVVATALANLAPQREGVGEDASTVSLMFARPKTS